MIIAEFPFQPYLDFMARTFGEDWLAFEGIIMNATYGIVAIVACFGVCSSLVSSYGIDGTPAGIISLSAFFTINVVSAFETADGTVEAWLTGTFTARVFIYCSFGGFGKRRDLPSSGAEKVYD